MTAILTGDTAAIKNECASFTCATKPVNIHNVKVLEMAHLSGMHPFLMMVIIPVPSYYDKMFALNRAYWGVCSKARL